MRPGSFYFCPLCGNILLIDTTGAHAVRACRRCEFRQPVSLREEQDVPLKPIDINAFQIGDADLNFNQVITLSGPGCARCGHNEADYAEVQIRSADEPTTQFFCCRKCRYRWRED